MNFYETEIIAIAFLKIVHTIFKVYSRNAKKKSFNCFVTAACIFLLLSEQKLLSKKYLFLTKIEFLTQAYTKMPCVNTEKPVGAQDNFSQSEQSCCKWQTLVGTKNCLCTQGNLCIGTTF